MSPCQRTRERPLGKSSVGKEKNVAHSCQCVTSALRDTGQESCDFHGEMSVFAAQIHEP
jgi:hypothetical protein